MLDRIVTDERRRHGRLSGSPLLRAILAIAG
jgi:hypothetical protein